MGDQQDRSIILVLQFLQKRQHLGLNGNVKSGCRFISNDQFGLTAYCHSYDNTLAHTAGQLIRICLHTFFRLGDPYLFQRFHCHIPGCLLVHILMGADHLNHLVSDLKYRVQACHGVLENNRYILAAEVQKLFLGKLQHIFAVKVDLAAYDLSGTRRKQTYNGGGAYALA